MATQLLLIWRLNYASVFCTSFSSFTETLFFFSFTVFVCFHASQHWRLIDPCVLCAESTITSKNNCQTSRHSAHSSSHINMQDVDNAVNPLSCLFWFFWFISFSPFAAFLLAAPAAADVREPVRVGDHLHQELGAGHHRGHRYNRAARDGHDPRRPPFCESSMQDLLALVWNF